MTTRRMTADEIAQYEREGYVNFGPILSPQELAEVQDYVADLVASLAPGVRPENMNMAHLTDRYLLDLCAHPAFLDAVEGIIGPNIVLFAAGMFCKPKGDGKEIPWHQDGIFWPLEPMRITTLWLGIDDSTVENGCMRVIPGTHKLGRIEHTGSEPGKALHLELDETRFDLSKAVNLQMKAGSCSFHEAFLIHGSNANNSPNRRCGFTVRYMAAECKFDRDQWPDPSHPLFLLRGEDSEGVNAYVDRESVPVRKRGEIFRPPY